MNGSEDQIREKGHKRNYKGERNYFGPTDRNGELEEFLWKLSSDDMAVVKTAYVVFMLGLLLGA